MKKEFSCGPQAKFEVMEIFFSLLLFHPEFRYYPATYQSQFLEENFQFSVSDQTLRNWKKKLIERNWIAIDTNDCEYYACVKNRKPRKMDGERHKALWREFFSRVQSGGDPDEVRREIYYKNNGMPRKQCGFMENGIYQEEMDELRKTLKQSENNAPLCQ